MTCPTIDQLADAIRDTLMLFLSDHPDLGPFDIEVADHVDDAERGLEFGITANEKVFTLNLVRVR
jgi:hypothetical protein